MRILALAAFAGFLAVPALANADVITLDLSGTLHATSGSATCAATCTISGTVVVDNSSGASDHGFVSADVTVSGVSPALDPLTTGFVTNSMGGGVDTELTLTGSNDELVLLITTTTAGSLAGYDGGADIANAGDTLEGPVNAQYVPSIWEIPSISLTPAANAVPEPASLGILGAALVGFALSRTRKRQVA